MLRLYGPEANPARGKLRQYAERKTTDLFPEVSRDLQVDNPFTYEVLQQVEYLCSSCGHPTPAVNGFWNRPKCLPPESAIHVGSWPSIAGTVLQRCSSRLWCSG